MKTLFKRQKPRRRCSQFYILIRFWWVQKMDRLTRGLSKPQLWFSLIIFTILGTGLSMYLALKGFLPVSHDRIRIDAIMSIRPINKDHHTVSHLPNITIKKDERQSSLSRFIDSVINASGDFDFHQIDNSEGKEIWGSPITEENKTANDKK